MLILARRVDEVILVGDDVKIVVCGIHKSKVLLGIVAPPDVPIHRSEVRDANSKEQATACST